MNEFDKMNGRAVLLAAVKETIFCPFSGKILDKARAVHVELLRDGKTITSVVVHAEAWDGPVSKNFAEVQEKINAGSGGYQTTDQLQVIDGREVFR